MEMQERLDNLVQQRELLKEQFIKVVGAIELLEGMMKEDNKDDAKKDKKKKD